MRLTVDASVVTKWFVPEPLFEEARLVLADPADLHAPDILLAEFANTIWNKLRPALPPRQTCPSPLFGCVVSL